MTNQWDDLIRSVASRHGVPFALVKATIEVESNGNASAINRKDPGWAWGLMQVIPATAFGLGYKGPNNSIPTAAMMQRLVDDPAFGVELGTKLLAENLRRAKGVVADTVSAYNGGFRPEYGLGSKRPNGTYGNQAYVDQVMAAYQRYAPFSDVSSGHSSTGVELAPYTKPVGNAPISGMMLAIAIGLGLLVLLRVSGKGLRL